MKSDADDDVKTVVSDDGGVLTVYQSAAGVSQQGETESFLIKN